jgi:hypothetical protein
MARLFSCCVVVLLALEVILAGGQAPAPPPLPDRFDISIKPAPSSRQGGGYDYPPGRFVSENRAARAGLTGQYDITLQWDDPPVANDQSRASIFTAVREQLGLRLDARTEPLEVVVIDRIERPAPD